ncbi:MAG: iron-sulfur cluster assembly scaffold protein [Proteobacteria bacterium]|nr:iron-sulfur cluster assembly scaffold protein [Pseudomonadota bacterium]
MISPEIIKFASDISNYGIKQNSKISAIVKNKICGDKITIELKITNKTIKKMSYETESCIFCQASASLLSKSIKNKNITNLSFYLENIKKNKNFKKLLKNKERINCINLPFEALKKAINTKK